MQQYGQGDNDFTPIQMAKYISILANGGNQVNPTIVKTIMNADGTEINREELESMVNGRINREPNEQQNIEISNENLKAVLEGMKGVTTRSEGTAYGVFKNFNIGVRRENRFSTKNNFKRRINKCLVCRICTI